MLASRQTLTTLSCKLAAAVAVTSHHRFYAKKPPTLTEGQIQFQKHTAELGFREKTSIKGTLFQFIDLETSIDYMKSEAFKKAYGEKHIWEWYIRNHKGLLPKSWTRKQCVHNGRYCTGNPCPICRDPYLVVHYKNLQLLKQFVSPDTGFLFETRRTSVCQKQHENLEIAYGKACDYGLMDHHIPHRVYDYTRYYPREVIANETVLYDSTVFGKAGDESLVDGSSSSHSHDSLSSVSALLGIVLSSNRKQITHIYDELKESDILIKADKRGASA